MTIVERLACAIAASRTGTIAGWRDCCADALAIIAQCRNPIALPSEPSATFAANDP